MFSLSFIIRVYILLSIVVLISFFVMLTSIDVLLEPIWNIVSLETENIFHNLYVTVIIMSLTTIVFGVFVTIFIQDRGINKYKDFLRRFESLGSHISIKLSMLRFPEEDEFGNLGSKLNSFLDSVDSYDQMKTTLAMLEKEKFESVAELLSYPILLINTESTEPYISYYNHAFRELFLKKNVFIDNNGKPQVQYYMIEGKPVVNFVLKNEFSEQPFLNQLQLNQLMNKNILWENNHIFRDMVFSDLSVEKKYQFAEILCIPLNNNIEKTMYQMLYIFVNPIQIEKKLVSSEE